MGCPSGGIFTYLLMCVEGSAVAQAAGQGWSGGASPCSVFRHRLSYRNFSAAAAVRMCSRAYFMVCQCTVRGHIDRFSIASY